MRKYYRALIMVHGGNVPGEERATLKEMEAYISAELQGREVTVIEVVETFVGNYNV